MPYAAFVQQQWAGSEQYPTVATPKEPDLTKFQMKTPFGSFGIETNDKKKINLFGRSNLGNPPIVPSGDANGNYQPGIDDLYIQSLFNNNNTAQPLDYDGLTYSSGPGDEFTTGVEGLVVPTADGVYDLGANWQSFGEGWNSLPVTQTGNTGGYGLPGNTGGATGGYGIPGNTQSGGTTGGYGITGNTQSGGTTGGYGSGNNNNNGTATAQGGYGYSPAVASNDALAGASSISAAIIDQIPNIDLVEYYSKLQERDNNLWKRKKRLTVSR